VARSWGVPLGAVSLLLTGLVAPAAEAAPQRRDSGPLFTQIDTGQGAAATARAQAVKGDCVHALANYDIALHSSIDMTIRRDRGLCHEALGNVFPAMDDYRAYLTVSPDAPDSADIRARLERLEIQTGVGGASVLASAKSAEDVPDEPAQITDTSIQTSDTGRRSKRKRYSYDAEENDYKQYDRAMTSPLRRGTGAAFAFTTDARGVYFPSSADYAYGYVVGGSIRWAFSQVSTLYGNLGYAAYQSGGFGSPLSTSGGVSVLLGYEIRIRLDQYASNQIVLGPAFEYQYISTGTSPTMSDSLGSIGSADNILLPQGRIGYRHIFGYGIGLEFLFHAGASIFIQEGAGVVASRDPLLGGTIALVLAF
jgi:hypothetical protein